MLYKATESSTETSTNSHGIDEAYEAVCAFCETVISNPRVTEFKEIRKVLADEAERLGVAVAHSQFKNLLRVVSNKVKELEFINYQQNKVLVYPSNLKIESLVIDNFELQSDLNRVNQTSLSGDSKTVMNAAKVLNEKIKNHSVEMPWPPEEKDLDSNNVAEYIPELLDIFCTILLSGQALDRDKSKSDRVVRLQNSLAQDIVYSVSNGAIKTPKSVLFPAVVKALCNNTEVVKLINKCGHGISYNLIEEIETEFALKVISEQTLNRVLIPDECNKPDSPPVALMVADNIDNLECSTSGTGTSHRVNSILVLKQEHREGAEDNSGGEVPEEPPAKRKCKRSLAGDVVNKEIPEYYRGRRVGPGVLSYVQYLGNSSSYLEITKTLHMHYRV